MRKIRVLVVDDHPLMLEAVRASLAGADDLEVVAVGSSGDDVLPLVRRHDPDLLLLDLRLPGTDGLTCLVLLSERHPELKVLVLSALDDPEYIEAALSRGACGHISKSIDPLDLPEAVRRPFEAPIYDAVRVGGGGRRRGSLRAGLTERECMILDGVARGLSNRAIGRELWVTERTVKFHLTNIYRKLGVGNRVEAAAAAYRLGIGSGPTLDRLPRSSGGHTS
jgi:DNA-binding NarL/FixJ family response regulator